MSRFGVPLPSWGSSTGTSVPSSPCPHSVYNERTVGDDSVFCLWSIRGLSFFATYCSVTSNRIPQIPMKEGMGGGGWEYKKARNFPLLTVVWVCGDLPSIFRARCPPV